MFPLSTFSFLSDLQNETFCFYLSSLFLSPENAGGPWPHPLGSIQAGPCSIPLRAVPLLCPPDLQGVL